MPYLDSATLPLPFGGRSQRSRHTSQQGAIVATVKAGSQASRMLLRYQICGALSDSDLAVMLGLPEARISARRAGLMVRGLVEYVDDVAGRYGALNCRWRLSFRGAAIAQQLQESA